MKRQSMTAEQMTRAAMERYIKRAERAEAEVERLRDGIETALAGCGFEVMAPRGPISVSAYFRELLNGEDEAA